MTSVGRVGPRTWSRNHGVLSAVVRDTEDGPSWSVDQAEHEGVAFKFAHGGAGTHLHFSDEDAYHIGNAFLRCSTFDPESKLKSDAVPCVDDDKVTGESSLKKVRRESGLDQ